MIATTVQVVALLGAAVQWQSPQMLAAALLVTAGIVVAVSLLYPAQVRSLPAGWRFVLPGLRCLALVVLAAALARPAAERVLGEEEQGAYVILVDNSRSMGIVDAQRSRASLVALADGLGLLPDAQRARAEEFGAVERHIQKLPGLFETIVQARIDLDYAALQARDNPDALQRFKSASAEFAQTTRDLMKERAKFARRSERLARAFDALRDLPKIEDDDWQERASKAIAGLSALSGQFQSEADDELYRNNPAVRRVCDELAGLTRFDQAARAIVGERGGLLPQLPAKVLVYGYTVGPEVRTLPLRGSGKNVKRLTVVDADGAASDLTGGVRDVLDRLRQQKVSAAVLLSDGRQVGEEAVVAAGLAGGGVPIYTVLTAASPADGRVRDTAIERIEMPSPANVFAGESMHVTVHVAWNGMAKPGEVTVQIGAYELRSPVEARPQNATRGTARFTLQFDESGPHRLTFSVPARPQELTDANNSAQRWVKVLSDRFEVLLVGGAPSWDFRYLRGALSRTPWVNLRTALLDADDAKLDVTPRQIGAYDVIILSDAPAKALSPEQWDAVRRAVVQRGASVILVAGTEHLPREYGVGPMAEFLPYRRAAALGPGAAVWRNWPGEDPEFRFVPAPGLVDSDLGVLALAEDPSESWYRWNALPPVYRYLAMTELKEAATPLLVERETHAPVLTRQRLGRGKVFFLGIDQTWRWRSKLAGDRDQERFFRQLLRAAADEPYAVSNGLLSLDADHVMIRPGESVRVRARVDDLGAEAWNWGGGPLPSASVDVDLVRDGAIVQTQSLPAVGDAASGRFEGRIGGLESGAYVIRLRAPMATGVEYPLHVRHDYERELLNLAGDADLLRRLAAASGGQFRTLDNVDEVPRLLADARKRAPRVAELRLWDSWYLYAVVVSALGAEWALRKRFGLA